MTTHLGGYCYTCHQGDDVWYDESTSAARLHPSGLSHCLRIGHGCGGFRTADVDRSILSYNQAPF
jgi:hypothetical protein